MSSLTEGLVGHWKFDESYGTSFSDVSGYNNSGTYYGETFNNGTIHGASWTEGKYGSALYFDGDDDYVEVADSDSLRPNEITILAWIKPSSLTNDKHIVTKSAVGTIYCSYGFRLHNNKLQYWMYDGSQDIWTTSTDVLPDTSWHYVGVTWKKPTVTFYIDDEIAGTAEIDTNPVYGSYPVAIGTRLYTSYAFPFSGIIDEVRIYNKALSEEEIQSIYQNNTFIRDGLKAYWRFDEGTGDTAYDTHHIAYSTNSGGSRYGNALSFDGVDDYIDVNEDFYTESCSLTWALWFKANSYPGSGFHYLLYAQGCNGGIAQFSGGRIAVEFRDKDCNIYVSPALISSDELELNKWYFVAATYDSVSQKLIGYVDGDKVWEVTRESHYDWGRTRIGGGGYDSAYFDGIIDDVRIYNRALTETEIRGLYNLYGAGSAKLIYSGSSYFYFYPTRWDEDNWSVVIETFLTDVHRDLLFANVVPGAVAELYNILGRPKYIDTTYNSGNTLIIVPYLPSISGLRKTRRIAVKSISDTFINPSTYRVKIEGLRLDTED